METVINNNAMDNSFVSTYLRAEKQVCDLFDELNDELDGAMESGFSEAQYKALGLPEHMFNKERRRGGRDMCTLVHVYCLRVEYYMDLATIGHIYAVLVTKK